ncbi:bicyclomycin/multidrug efflux system [compost metagenome]
MAKLGIGEDPNFMLDKAAMANLDAIYLAAYAVGQFTWGMLADRFGPRVVVLGGLLISAVAAVVMGSYATFLLCLRRPGGLAVRRLVGLYPGRYLARGVLLQCRRGGAGGRAVLLPAAQQA